MLLQAHSDLFIYVRGKYCPKLWEHQRGNDDDDDDGDHLLNCFLLYTQLGRIYDVCLVYFIWKSGQNTTHTQSEWISGRMLIKMDLVDGAGWHTNTVLQQIAI